MSHCPTLNTTAPLALIIISRLLETSLAQIICFFDALERLIPPYVILVTLASIGWSINQYSLLSGLIFGIPLGLVMAFVHAIFIVILMFMLGILLWLTLIPIYLIASSCHWQLPTVLEQNPTVESWLQRWSSANKQQNTAPAQSTTQQLAALMIGVLLGNWLLD
ncbi:MAG: hypothetical protein RBR22_11325 [Desulfuromonas sp.]|nr:hypothetical protein [Desulfuromonas sp.]